MSIITNYPAKITKYSVRVSHTKAFIRLFGFENSASQENENNSQSALGDIHFSLQESESTRSNAFINRGGFVNASYPFTMLSSILTLLNQKDALYINDDGSFTNQK
ncbi:hypothetical protein [Algibacter lectus]|uniref:hypothetical protein n=1 Tax=Algibacter lectus TaxID=221126 RepID=UPI002495446D|nr:hypothetical protein [Algibacter lectus]